MNKMIIKIFVCFGFIFIFTQILPSQEVLTKEKLIAILKTEIKKNTDNLKNYRLEVKHTLKKGSKDKEGKTVISTVEIDSYMINQNENRLTNIKENNSETGFSQTVYLLNKNYYAQIDKKETGFLVSKIKIFQEDLHLNTKSDEDKAINEMKEAPKHLHESNYRFELFIENYTIDHWIQEKAFEITKVENIIENNDKLIKVSFNVDFNEEGFKKRGSGYLVFNPQLNWVGVRAEFYYNVSYGTGKNILVGNNCSAKNFKRYKIENGIPFLTESENHYIINPGTNNELINEDYSKITYKKLSKPLPQSEFTLTHFGLPEPIGVTWPKPPTPPYIWLLRLAAGLAILSFCFYLANKIVNRKKKNTSI